MPKLTCPAPGCSWESQDLDAAFASALTTQLQIHNSSAHTAPDPPKLKLEPPKVGLGCNPDQWSSFTRQWQMYKRGMNIPTTMTSTALFYCCSEELRTCLMRDIRQEVSAMREDELLTAIKTLAVQEQSILVHRMKLSKMTQPPGTGIRTFLADLRGQASLCQFIANCKEPGCSHKLDYSDEMIKDNLIRGIADPEIMADLLGDTKIDKTLEETVNFIAQKEQGKATRTVVGDNLGAISHPTRPEVDQRTPQNTLGRKCWACGGPSHGPTNDKNTRAKHCPAWQSTCPKCSVRGHYSVSCRKCTDCHGWGHNDSSSKFCTKRKTPRNKQQATTCQTEDYSPEYAQLCSTTSHVEDNEPSQDRKSPINHHIYDGQWVARPSKPHPIISAHLRPLPADHEELGYPVSDGSKLTTLTIPMIADSGCQSSIMPLKTAHTMGFGKNDIIPVNLSMSGAIKEDLGVEGAIIAEVALQGSDPPRSTKQLIYLSAKMTKAFLCREALENLGVIPTNFPEIPDQGPQNYMAMTDDTPIHTCHCPKRSQNPPPLPKEFPPGLTPSDEDVPRIKEWLLDYYAGTTFNVCEHQPLPMMNCQPLELHVDPNAKPVAVHKPALVPIHWQEKVFQDLERDVRIGVLEKVSPNTPVTWCSRMVVAAKADGSPRRTVDLQPQNRHSVRQTHHVPSPFHLADRIPQNTKKTVTDAWNGYHSVPIREEDRHITTFITPWGRYRYKVAPQGFLASGDAYNHRFDAIIAEFQNKVKCVDDTCMWTDSIEAAFYQTCQWLDLCARNGITLNPNKFQFAQDSVEFAGLTVTSTNVKPSQKFLDSILGFPTPKDISGARAWFGLVNQGAYAFSMAKQMKPFRHLLKPATKFEWTDELNQLFNESKEIIVEEMKDGVRLFDASRPTCLSTDWSVDGIGFLLTQKYCSCTAMTPTCCPDGWKLCLVGSRFTTPAESRYAPIEGEALAVAYALHQTRYYVLGCSNLIVATDHKPLLQVLNDRSLSEINNRRLLKLKEKTIPFRFSIVHVPGSKNKGPDAASRYPAHMSTSGGDHSQSAAIDEQSDVAEDSATVSAASDTLYSVTNVVTWPMVREATASDPTLSQLMHILQAGMPKRQSLPADLRPFHRYAASLSCIDGVILLGQRIVVPTPLRKDVLSALHAAHQGVGAMCQRATDSVFWPGMSADITRIREECEHCHRIAKSNAMQPPSDITPADYPFQKVCCDYFHHNNIEYVVLVDRYSNWPMAFKADSGAEGLVKRLREAFVTFGIPEELTSDGGPQFRAGKTHDFLTSWGVHHRISSVANAHANCRAEIAVKTVKRMLMDNTGPTGSLDVDKFQRAMLIYRNSIDQETNSSPAMVLFGRPIRDPIPIPMGRYCPHQTWQETMHNREIALAKRHSREKEKWSQSTRQLPPLQIGDHVYLQNLIGNHPRRWERTGVVIEVRQFHQYVIRIDGSGRVTLRNRQHLRKFTPFNSTKIHAVTKLQSAIETQKPTRHTALPQSPLPLPPPAPTPNGCAKPTPICGWIPVPANPSEPGSSSHSCMEPSPTTDNRLVPASTTEMYNALATPQEGRTDQSPHTPTAAKETDRPGPTPFSGPSTHGTPGKKLPLALRRLLPHNESGAKSSEPSRRPSRKDSK